MDSFTTEELRALYWLINNKVCDLMILEHKKETSDNVKVILEIEIDWMKSLENKIVIEIQNRK